MPRPDLPVNNGEMPRAESYDETGTVIIERSSRTPGVGGTDASSAIEATGNPEQRDVLARAGLLRTAKAAPGQRIRLNREW